MNGAAAGRPGFPAAIHYMLRKHPMSSMKGIVRVAFVFGSVLTLNAGGPQPPLPAPQEPVRGPGGRVNVIATLFTDKCAGCHGATIQGARAPSLFDAKWNYASDDEGLSRIIHDGIEG